MSKKLSDYEWEATINFNETKNTASILIYDRSWQKHLESKLCLKPVLDNGFGDKAYEIDNKCISMPGVPRKLSDLAREKLAGRLHHSRVLSKRSPVLAGKTITKML